MRRPVGGGWFAGGRNSRYRDAHRLPQLPGDRDHELPRERRDAREGPDDGEPRVGEDNQLYDRVKDEITLDEVERIAI